MSELPIYQIGEARVLHRPLDPRAGDPPNTWKEIGTIKEMKMTEEKPDEQPLTEEELKESRLDEREEQTGPPPDRIQDEPPDQAA